MRVGDLEVLPVHDGQLILDEPPGLPKDVPEFAPHREYFSDGQWVMDIGAFVVRSGDRVVLLDAGAGPGTQTPVSPGPYDRLEEVPQVIIDRWRSRGRTEQQIAIAACGLHKTSISTGGLAASLQEIGVAPEDVTDVVLSHLHYDHTGWVSKDQEPYFPNAAIRAERRDLDHFLRPEQEDDAYLAALYGDVVVPAAERLGPVLDRIEPWDGDASIAAGIDMRFAPGHTPGNCFAVLSSGSARAMVLGDTVHCPLELTEPEYSMMGDLDQALADRARALIRKELEQDPSVHVTAQHFSGLRFGRILPGVGRHGWMFERSLST